MNVIGQLQVFINDGYYLLGINVAKIESGTIIHVRDGVGKAMIDKKPTINIGAVKESLIKLQEDEARFLAKVPADRRLKKHEKGKFRIF